MKEKNQIKKFKDSVSTERIDPLSELKKRTKSMLNELNNSEKKDMEAALGILEKFATLSNVDKDLALIKLENKK